jgi:hypothetical protein
MHDSWWYRAHEIAAQCAGRDTTAVFARRYRFADGQLYLDCEDAPLARRFQDLYAEGSDEGAACTAPVQVQCVVRAYDPTLAAVIFRDPEPLDAFAFCRHLFPNRDFVEGPGAGGWRTISLRQTPSEPQIALYGNQAVVDRRQAWQPFMANYAINRVLRLQREVLFFHAASVGIAGRGVLMVGPKGAGKTTTALTLAARGHDFFGDELAAVRCSTKALLPFRRAVSIRAAGPRARRVEDRLAWVKSASERFSDGSERTLVDVGRLFPQAGVSPTSLSCVLFLRQFAEQPIAQRFTFRLEHFPMLSPLACSMWGVPAGARIVDVSRLLHQVECYQLDLGDPDETADLVERIAYGATSVGDRQT